MIFAGLVVIVAMGIMTCLFFVLTTQKVTGWATREQDVMMTGD